jgi:hypothetical protein
MLHANPETAHVMIHIRTSQNPCRIISWNFSSICRFGTLFPPGFCLGKVMPFLVLGCNCSKEFQAVEPTEFHLKKTVGQKTP